MRPPPPTTSPASSNAPAPTRSRRAPGPERARRLGADGWAGDAVEASALLRDWEQRRPSATLSPTRLDPGAAELDARAHELAGAAFDELELAFPAMAGSTADRLLRTRKDLASVVRHVAAAKLVDDPDVLTDYLEWVVTLLNARDLPTRALLAGLEVLQPAIAGIDGEAGRLVDLGLRSVVGGF